MYLIFDIIRLYISFINLKLKNIIGGVSIRVKSIKLASFAILAGILIPTNIFVYGTSDTSYVDTVSSTIEVVETQVANQVNTVGVDTGGLIPLDIANIMGIEYTDDESVSLILGDELAGYDIAILSDKSEEELDEVYKELNNLTEAKLNDYTVVDMTNEINTDIEISESYELVTKEHLKSYKEPSETSDELNEYSQHTSVLVTSVEKDGFVLLDNGKFDEWIKRDLLCTAKEYSKSLQGSALLDIDNPDINYNGGAIKVTGAERDLLERLVMGEAGSEGFEGACLVAQTIRDFMMYKGYNSVESVRVSCKYSGSISIEPSDDVKRAVAFIFDDGGYAVRHRIFYFYAFKWCKSSWHETQPFVIQYGGHRFFDSKY